MAWHDLLERVAMQPSGVPVADEYHGPTSAFRGTETGDVAGYLWSLLRLAKEHVPAFTAAGNHELGTLVDFDSGRDHAVVRLTRNVLYFECLAAGDHAVQGLTVDPEHLVKSVIHGRVESKTVQAKLDRATVRTARRCEQRFRRCDPPLGWIQTIAADYDVPVIEQGDPGAAALAIGDILQLIVGLIEGQWSRLPAGVGQHAAQDVGPLPDPSAQVYMTIPLPSGLRSTSGRSPTEATVSQPLPRALYTAPTKLRVLPAKTSANPVTWPWTSVLPLRKVSPNGLPVMLP